MNLNDLETFVVVAEVGTFSAAAEWLDVPTSTVSRRVARLEEDLGIALLKRSARSIALSDDGRALADRCTPAIRELGRVERGLGDTADTPRGALRITTSIDFGSSDFFTQLISAYAMEFDEVDVEFEITNRMVDLLEEGFDVAFRIHSGSMPDRDDLVVRRLGRLSIDLYASPDYVQQHGPISQLDQLAEHPIIGHAGPQQDLPSVEPRILANDYGPLSAILADGAGIGALPIFVAAPLMRRGELVRLDLPLETPSANLFLVWLRSRHLAPRVRALIDLAADHANATDWSA